MDIYSLIARGTVKSVQRGVVQPSSTSTPAQVTISPVNPKKSVIFVNSTNRSYAGCYGYFVTNDVIAIGGDTVNLHWQIVEFN
jgi:hypothetical protein